MCSSCDYTTKTMSSLNIHLKCVHDETPYVCKVCSKSYNGKFKLKAHMKTTHTNAVSCHVCGKVVKQLAKHLRTEHTSDEDKRFKCDICGKGFVEKQKRDNHLDSVHSKIKRFDCRYDCGASSFDKGNRKKHEIAKHGIAFENVSTNIEDGPKLDSSDSI